MLGALLFAAALISTGPAQDEPEPVEDPIVEFLLQSVAAFNQPTNAARTEVAVQQLRAAGFEPVVETFQGGNARTGPMEGRNITAVFGPEGAKEILLVAHYDAVVLPNGELADGVVDNAAAVVGIIEAAKRLRERPLTHRVRIIFFDQEELGLIGARKWVEAHGLGKVAAVINSDVAAFGQTLMYGLNNGEQSAEVVRAVRIVCAERAMDCVGYPNYPPSDDRVFSGYDLPAASGERATAAVPTVSLGFQDDVGARQMWLALNGAGGSGLAEGFVPRVFQVIHSEADTMDNVDFATVYFAGEVYADIVTQLDADLADEGPPGVD